MKSLSLLKLGLVSTAAASFLGAASAAPFALQGSDTLASVTTDAIISGGLDATITYIGGGSGKGEAGLLAKTQGLAPMSRAFSDAGKASATAAGIKLKEHVIGLDAVSLFVNGGNTLDGLDLDTVRRIYACEITSWSQVGGQAQPMVVYARNSSSGTTDTFKSLVKIKEFGACVKVLPETADIAIKTASEANAIGFSGLSARRPGNRILPLAASAGAQMYEPSPVNVRSFAYPLSRKLFVYEASGAVSPNQAENELLDLLLDPSFINPILLDHDFITVK